MVGWMDGPSVRNPPKMSHFLNENHRGSPTLMFLNVLGVLNVINMLMVASLAGWALFFFLSLSPLAGFKALSIALRLSKSILAGFEPLQANSQAQYCGRPFHTSTRHWPAEHRIPYFRHRHCLKSKYRQHFGRFQAMTHSL